MNRCASAGPTLAGAGIFFEYASSFRSALASASGSCERWAPDSSAWNSRDREMAIWIRPAARGATIHEMRKAKGPNELFRSSLPPKKNANRARNVIDMAIPAATDPIRMSWLVTWESSWERTARSSRSSTIWSRPLVTATAACCGFRPVANAFGWAISLTYIRGIGMPFAAVSSRTMA